MEELLEMRQLLEAGRYPEALALATEIEDMGRKGLAHNIGSYLQILLIHLIKQQAEQRTTHSWEVSIRNAVFEINDLNSRPGDRGMYLTAEEVRALLAHVWPNAVRRASLEVAEGHHTERELLQLLDFTKIQEQALRLLYSPTDSDPDSTSPNG